MKEAKVQPGRFSGVRLIIGVISIFIVAGLTRSVVGHWQKGAIVSERQEALRAEEARNRELIQRLKEATSAAFIEKEAREKLGFVKEGDTVVLLERNQSPAFNDLKTEVDSTPNWKKWWKLFF